MPQNSGTKNLIVILCILFSLVIGLATAYSYQGSGTLSSPISFISPSGEYVSSPDGGNSPHIGPSSHIAGPADVVPIPVPASPVGPCCVILNTDETWNLSSDTCNESDSACYSCGGTWMDSDTDENWEAICQAAQPVVKEKPCCVNVENNGQWSLLDGNCANGSNICENNCGGTWVNPTTDKNWAEICQAGEDGPTSCCIDLQGDGEYTYLQLPYNQSANTCFNGGGLWIDETTDENYREICVDSVSPTPFVPSPTCPCLCESGPTGEVVYSPSPSATAPISPAPAPISPAAAPISPAAAPTAGVQACDQNNPISGCDNSEFCGGGDAGVTSYYISDTAKCSAKPGQCADNDALVAFGSGGEIQTCKVLIDDDEYNCDTISQQNQNIEYGDICPKSCANNGFCEDVAENFMMAGDMPNRSFQTAHKPTVLDPQEKEVVKKIAKFGTNYNLGENIGKYIKKKIPKSKIAL